MSWRTVVISSRCKLDLKLGYMVIRGAETKRIFLDEVTLLLIENPAVSLTGCLLEALTERKIRIIFCDSKCSPMAELVPHHGSHDTTRKLRQQLLRSNEIKGAVWSRIVSEKIRLQAQHLADRKLQKEALLLESYLPQIEFQDASNREGHAAKVYFNFDLPCTVSCDKIGIGGVFRSAGLGILDDYGNDLEHILDYMELTRELERDKLFVLVNLRSFYSNEEIAAFFQSVLDHSLCVLLVDSVSKARLPLEKRITVDADLCEF